MDSVPGNERVSPYSAGRFTGITWQDVSPGWLGIYRAVEWADPPVLEYLKYLKFATRAQLLKNFYGNPVNGKKRIERMARTGVLLRHSLESRAAGVALYTLGPLGAELVRERWAPNWWRSFSLADVLKYLVTGELYLGVSSAWACEFVPAGRPLTAFLTFGGLEYGVLVLRDDVERVRRQIARQTAMRLIVVVERIGDAARLNTCLEVPARYVTDQDLLAGPFAGCVAYSFKDGVLVSERVVDEAVVVAEIVPGTCC